LIKGRGGKNGREATEKEGGRSLEKQKKNGGK